MKVRFRFIVALAVTLVFAACVGLSGVSPEQALNGKMANARQLTCPGNVPVIVGMTESGQNVLVTKDKAIVVYFDKDGEIESVLFGDLALVDGKFVFKLQEKLNPEQTRAKYPDPCMFLAPREV